MPWRARPKADASNRVSPYVWEHPSWRKWHKDVATGKRVLDIKIHIKLADGTVYDTFCKRTRNTLKPPFGIVEEG